MISGTNDCVFPCGDLTSGAYKVSFDLYVPSDRVGYFNIQQVFASAWGMSLTFMPDASITVSCGEQAPSGFTFPQNTWFPITVNIDLDTDLAECFVNNDLIAQWQWSLKEDGDPEPINWLASICMLMMVETEVLQSVILTISHSM